MLRSILLTLVICFPASAQTTGESEPEKLRIITHNVWYGFTKKTEPRYADWKRWMKAQAPDVVSLQELNTYTEERLRADAQSWGHPYSVLLKEDGFPTGITSRYPINDVKRIRRGFHHGLLRCRIQGIWFYVIHFHPSHFQRRIDEAALVKQDVESLPEENPKVVLAGDFNGFSPADQSQYDSDQLLVPFFRGLDQKDSNARNLNDGRLDYGGIQAILDQGYTDLIASRRSAQLPFVGTFPAALVSDQDHGTDRRLDYIFVSPSADNNNNNRGGARKLWRFNLNPDGSMDAATQTLIYDWGSTRGPDGLKLDTAGRLYVAAGLNRPNLPYETADPPTAGIYVFSPAGELLEFVAIPRDETTNCAFGGADGKTLFVTAGGTLWSIRTTTPGQGF